MTRHHAKPYRMPYNAPKWANKPPSGVSAATMPPHTTDTPTAPVSASYTGVYRITLEGKDPHWADCPDCGPHRPHVAIGGGMHRCVCGRESVRRKSYPVNSVSTGTDGAGQLEL